MLELTRKSEISSLQGLATLGADDPPLTLGERAVTREHFGVGPVMVRIVDRDLASDVTARAVPGLSSGRCHGRSLLVERRCAYDLAGGIVASMGTIPLVTILAGGHRSFACHALYLGECLVNGQVPQIHEEDHQHEARVRVRFACAPLCLLQGTRPLQLCDAELALDAGNLCHFG